METFTSHLKQLCNDADLAVTDEQLQKMAAFYNLLISENEKTNLTRITDPAEAALKHFVDSIVPYRIFAENASVIDIGTGPGFPAVPLVIMRPDISMTVVEASEKKCAFVSKAAAYCDLDVRIITGRAEELAMGPEREGYNACVTRAVAALPVLLELCVPFVKPGGLLLCYKADYQEELTASAGAERKLGVRLKSIMDMPVRDLDHHILIFEKIAKTPVAYPRRFAKIKKAPL